MGFSMVGTVNFTSRSSQTTFSADNQSSIGSSSVDALHSDPDLLVKAYFRASPEERANLRKLVAYRPQSWLSFKAILEQAYLPSHQDAYDGAVDLIAECTSSQPFEEFFAYLITMSRLASQRNDRQKRLYSEYSWEVLIQGIGCAHRLTSQTRLRLLRQIARSDLFQIMNCRGIKAVFLDALTNIAESNGLSTESTRWVRTYVQFVQTHDPDEYIQTYAKDVLADLA
jgi:hypothetical protein